MKKTLPIILLTLASLAMSCDTGKIFHERKTLSPEMTWDKDSVLSYNVDIKDVQPSYDIEIDLRTVDFYQYSNMWLFITTASPSGARQADTVEYRLRDDKGFSNGNRMAFGEVEDYEFPFKQNVKFPEPGVYTFSIRHGMRTEVLPFVNEVGLAVRKHAE